MATAANGVQVSCQVEIEVPQPCKFIMKTRDCSLSKMSSTRPDRKPVFVKSSSSEDFFFAMNRTALKFTVDDNSDIQLFPETDEAVKILNIKRGIISALMVPMKDEKRSLSVQYGRLQPVLARPEKVHNHLLDSFD
ncbi:Apolipoprotein B-100 [Takifugu flavidus]|uniref:Apolipoprotein B-100 n=1 Tax=Takifugu flavidus TaxID=433684 RepID=A0A5C6MHV5_9TELE|nr:Apolipoprotein B-100 [Takifugu flavidus]